MRRWMRGRVIGVAVAVVMSGVAFGSTGGPTGADHADCAQRYVASGDGVVWGKDVDSPGDSGKDTKRYSNQLLKEHLENASTPAPGPWCEYNTSKNPTDTDTFVNDNVFENLSQQGAGWERDPLLITLTLGRQNNTIVDHVDKCFKQVKDHDFLDANACALAVLSVPSHWEKLGKDLAAILNTYRIQQTGAPNLIVAVTGYYNPYPSATSVATKIPGFCAKLIDTIPTCIARWVLLPPALITLDQVVQKLNKTIEAVVEQFNEGSQQRFVFVNPYEKFKDHCMEMRVTIKTKVYHPPPVNDVHDHNAEDTNFGCDQTWVASDGTDGTKSPFLYLTPAVTGVLIHAEQTTKKMGINPNEKGHDCIADLIWEAVKHKLDVPETVPDPTGTCTG